MKVAPLTIPRPQRPKIPFERYHETLIANSKKKHAENKATDDEASSTAGTATAAEVGESQPAPIITAADAMKKWENLSSSEKEVYEKSHEEALKEYHEAMRKFQESPEYKEWQRQSEQAQLHNKMEKMRKDLDKAAAKAALEAEKARAQAAQLQRQQHELAPKKKAANQDPFESTQQAHQDEEHQLYTRRRLSQAYLDRNHALMSEIFLKDLQPVEEEEDEGDRYPDDNVLMKELESKRKEIEAEIEQIAKKHQKVVHETRKNMDRFASDSAQLKKRELAALRDRTWSAEETRRLRRRTDLDNSAEPPKDAVLVKL